MIQISEVNIISVDKSEEVWAIEGEIIFESVSTPFSVNYTPDYDELEDLEIEINPGNYDKSLLKEMIANAAQDFDE